MREFLRWGISSLLGCTIYFGVGFAIPQWILGAIYLHDKGMLTPMNALVLALGALLGGAIIGVLGWFTVFKSLNERWHGGPRQ
jgi:hypothetical protein